MRTENYVLFNAKFGLNELSFFNLGSLTRKINRNRTKK